MKKIKFILLVFIISLSQVSCQNFKNTDVEKYEKALEASKKYDYYFKDSLLFFKGKPFEVCGKIEDYIKVFGKYDRVVREPENEKVLSFKVTRYYFENDIIGEKNEESSKIFMNRDYGESKNYEIISFKNIAAAVKKYGPYKTAKTEIITPDIVRHYAWDKAGLEAFSTNDTIHDINIKFVRSFSDEFDEEVAVREHKEKTYIKVKKAFTGTLCFDDKVVNVGMPNPEGWNTSIRKLGFSGDNYDPEGDGSSTMRKITRRFKKGHIRFRINRQIESENDKDMISFIKISFIKPD